MKLRADHPIKRLGAAFRKNDLTLYIGAGASAASGVPTWHDLVLSVFLNSLRIRRRSDIASWALIQATAERYFAQSRVSLEVAARELRASFHDPEEFGRWVRFGLYQSFEFDSHGSPTRRSLQPLLRRNATLRAITKLCRHTRPGDTGLRGVVTYNLDGLLELALGSYSFESIWKPVSVKPGVLPIYHVHGYVPVRDPFHQVSQRMGSSHEEIVLTEDQYHHEAADPYSWANLVQLQAMTSSVGATIGLSLSDPNMRRLLDVTRRAPARPQIYALVQRQEATELDGPGLQEIGNEAQRILEWYQGSVRNPLLRPDMKSRKVRQQVRQIWVQVQRQSVRRQISVLRELGVEPVWCRHSEIPSIVDAILGYAGQRKG